MQYVLIRDVAGYGDIELGIYHTKSFPSNHFSSMLCSLMGSMRGHVLFLLHRVYVNGACNESRARTQVLQHPAVSKVY